MKFFTEEQTQNYINRFGNTINTLSDQLLEIMEDNRPHFRKQKMNLFQAIKLLHRNYELLGGGDFKEVRRRYQHNR